MKKKKILIVFADFYKDISSSMFEAVNEYEFDDKHDYFFEAVNVPGVFEIPVTIVKHMDSFDGFVALGCVIKGKTPHFDFIASAITKSLLDLSIDYKVPVTNGIITSLTRAQALERSSKNKNKGREAANAAISLLKHL